MVASILVQKQTDAAIISGVNSDLRDVAVLRLTQLELGIIPADSLENTEDGVPLMPKNHRQLVLCSPPEMVFTQSGDIESGTEEVIRNVIGYLL